jgi:peptide/nickel transport system substrate-binding protein
MKHESTNRRRIDQVLDEAVSRRGFVLGASALAGASVVGRGAAQEATPGSDPFGEPASQGGTAVIAVGGVGNPRVLVGTSYYGTQAFFVSKLLYTPLLLLDRTWGNLGPGLASEWSWNDEGTVLTMTLREDVVFHDGTPLTSADVEFTYRLGVRFDTAFAVRDVSVLEGADAFLDGSSEELPGVQAIDDYTVQFTLTRPSNVFELNLSNCGILPKHLFAEDVFSGTATIEELPFFNGESGSENGLPVGTGPWKAAEFNPDTNLTLERNDSYFLGAPILDQIIFRYGVEGPAIIAGLESGEFDSAYVTPEDARSLETSEIVTLQSNHDLANSTVLITATEKDYLGVPVRKALIHALDRQALIDTITYGYAADIPSVMMYPALLPNDELATYEFDADKAKQMLDEAGWDWERTLQFGQFTTTGAPTTTISAVMSMWSDIGLKVEFLPMDSAAQTDIAASETHEYDVTMTSFAWLAYDPSSSYSSFACERRPNYSNYCNEEYDSAMQEAMGKATTEEAVPFYQAAAVILQDEIPYAPLWMDAEIWAVNGRLHGGVLGRGPLNNIESEKWWKEAE